MTDSAKALIAEAREKAEKATYGPWDIERTDDTNWIGPMKRDGRKADAIVCHTDREGLTKEALAANDGDAEFIAASRAIVPALADLAEKALGVVEAAKHYVVERDRDGGYGQAMIALRAALKKGGF